jgi:hypothetical protein
MRGPTGERENEKRTGRANTARPYEDGERFFAMLRMTPEDEWNGQDRSLVGDGGKRSDEDIAPYEIFA